jgi:hypothetical protein
MMIPQTTKQDGDDHMMENEDAYSSRLSAAHAKDGSIMEQRLNRSTANMSEMMSTTSLPNLDDDGEPNRFDVLQ